MPQRRGQRVTTALAACCSCKVAQFLCCSLRAGVLFLSILLFVNACLALAGEAVLYFDLAAAVVSQLEGEYLAPGTKLAGDARVHGGLITAGVYALLASLIGFYGAVARSVRAMTVFYILQIINSVFAISVLLIVVFVGATSFPTLLAQAPGIVLNIYLCIVVKSYRAQLLGSSAQPLSGESSAASGADVDKYRDPVMDVDDELTVTPRDVGLGPAGGRSNRGGAKVKVGDVTINMDALSDDDDNDIGRPSRI